MDWFQDAKRRVAAIAASRQSAGMPRPRVWLTIPDLSVRAAPPSRMERAAERFQTVDWSWHALVAGLLVVGTVAYWLVPEGSRTGRRGPAAEAAPAWGEGEQTRLWGAGSEPNWDSGPVDPRIERLESDDATMLRPQRSASPEDSAANGLESRPVAEFIGTIQARPQLRASHERDGPRIH